MDTAQFSLWTSRPRQWITVLMGVWFLPGSAMAPSILVQLASVDRSITRPTPVQSNPRLQLQSNIRSNSAPSHEVQPDDDEGIAKAEASTAETCDEG